MQRQLLVATYMSVIVCTGICACLICTASTACSPILEDLDISEAARALWEAPFAVLSHNRFEDDEPKFTYANQVSSESLPHWSCSTAVHLTAWQGWCSLTCHGCSLYSAQAD